jgi:hypothetical protein
MLSKRVEDGCKQHGVQYNKGSVAKKLAANIRAMKSVTELPAGTGKKVEKLFDALLGALPYEDE